jgi:hypothetical protein
MPSRSVAPDYLAHDGAQRRVRRRCGNSQLRKRSCKPRQMRQLVERGPANHSYHLVDAVGELIAAIFNVYRCRMMWQVLGLNVSHS